MIVDELSKRGLVPLEFYMNSDLTRGYRRMDDNKSVSERNVRYSTETFTLSYSGGNLVGLPNIPEKSRDKINAAILWDRKKTGLDGEVAKTSFAVLTG